MFKLKEVFDLGASLVAQLVKNPPVMQGTGGEGLIPGLGRSPGGGHATHSSILAWRIPWTEEPGWLQSMGSQRVKYNGAHPRLCTLRDLSRGLTLLVGHSQLFLYHKGNCF